MATRLPPPKRIKLDNGVPIPAPEPTASAPVPNIVVQFVSEDDGKPLAPAVNIPADFGRDGLEVMINKLSSKDEDPTPYAFHVNAPNPSDLENTTRILISNSIQADVLDKPTSKFTSEDVITVYCSPQAVFRVRPATRCSSTLSGHSSAILCAAFSPTGSMLATGSGDNNARLWNLDTETPSHTLSGHKGWVLCVEWEPTERNLATGGHDGQVRLWEPKTGKPIGDALKGHSKWVTSLSWEPVHINPKNPRLASSSKDGTGRLLHTLKDHAHWVTTLALNTDFVLRTGPYDHTGKASVSDEEVKSRAQKRYNDVTSNTPELIISGSDDHTLFLWSVFGQHPAPSSDEASAKVKPLARLTGHQRQIAHVAFSPDGRWAASGAWDSSVRVWEGRTGKFVATLRGHVGPVYRLTWSADSRLLVSASKDSTIKASTDLPGHTDEVYCVDFVADKIVSGGKDCVVKIWKN
ncbi:unnamed protein product [Rhizoctonia solani]|uniref:NLE domain-containing protein n=1 Tax=Rhizoctonia solani TaxID=456999 RepID=A0A8H3GGK2_9AGAM|nr:unnamed protein product [Rhizoctonia solani]CAE6448203.1 unnamed protein product [Rhizoctonia solani]